MQYGNQNKNGIMVNVIVIVQSIVRLENVSWNSSTWICKYSKHLKSIVDDSVLVRDEIISVMNSVSMNITNTMPTIVNKF